MNHALKIFLALAAIIATAYAAQFEVKVGEGGLKFVPATVTAKAGDTVKFTLSAGSHTVVQVNDGTTCTAGSGFNSGALKADTPFVYTVTDKAPKVWFICTVAQHCQAGMRGVIMLQGAAGGSNTTAPTTSSTPGGTSGTPTTTSASSGSTDTNTSGGSTSGGSTSGTDSGTTSGSGSGSNTTTTTTTPKSAAGSNVVSLFTLMFAMLFALLYTI